MADDFARVYPLGAEAASVWGRVVLQCKVAEDGRLRDCVVASETPQTWGFAKAALELVPLFQLTPPQGGPAVGGGEVTIPIEFETPGRCANCQPAAHH
jgi:TonB family protein